MNARQENVLWPEIARNAATVDGYLWRGNPKTTKVQRAGSVICGWFVLGIALICVTVVFQRDSFNVASSVDLVFAVGFTYVEGRLIRNAFLH
jgi:hypothetical protein